MVGPLEATRRAASRWTDRLRSLPILALNVHSACNCRCVMCDIWKANADKRELSLADLDRHVADIEALHVQRVMLTGGEPLLHGNLWALCDRLQDRGIRVTLVTTGLLLSPHAAAIARGIDDVVVSIDGPPEVHDAIRRVRGGFDRISRGLAALREQTAPPTVVARSVVQRANFRCVGDTIEAIRALPVDSLSFLAADVTSTAFNRPLPWDASRRSDVALDASDVAEFASMIEAVESCGRAALRKGFVRGGMKSLRRIHRYYAAMAGLAEFPAVTCNAPWCSAVVEPTGEIRPCFFHPPYATEGAAAGLLETVNSEAALAFRRSLSVGVDETCRRCVCSLSLPLWARA
jgi:MoaA/NifB/PqqE/SkfB family radical SAM enzyme